MAKGNFIEYIVSNDPNKYPDKGEYDGYYYEKINAQISLPEKVDDALIFYSEAPFRMCITNKQKNWDGTLQYSTNYSNWTEWNGEFIEGVDGIIYMRGIGNTYLNTSSIGSLGAFHFETKKDCFIHCIGSMDNLLDYSTIPTLAKYCYSYMFYNCTSLTTAPELPATTLASKCYHSMFFGCTNLTTVPQLPATTLTDYCYSYMFNDCVNLTTTPELPATTLADSCYYYMFCGCTSLTITPELPATTLATCCYQYMFSGCTNLTTPPALSATTLAGSCYRYMFYNCTNLTTAPELPATTMAVRCYSYMFSGCANLTTVPKLPATTLADYCYQYMFGGCTNIKFSTTQTGEYQTEYRIPMTGTGTTATNALTNMFSATGGTFKETPSINTTYYTSNTVV